MSVVLDERVLELPILEIPHHVREKIWITLDAYAETPVYRIRVLFWRHSVRLKALFPIIGRVVPRP